MDRSVLYSSPHEPRTVFRILALKVSDLHVWPAVFRIQISYYPNIHSPLNPFQQSSRPHPSPPTLPEQKHHQRPQSYLHGRRNLSVLLHSSPTRSSSSSFSSSSSICLNSQLTSHTNLCTLTKRIQSLKQKAFQIENQIHIWASKCPRCPPLPPPQTRICQTHTPSKDVTAKAPTARVDYSAKFKLGGRNNIH